MTFIDGEQARALAAKWRTLAYNGLRSSGTWTGNDIADRIEYMADELEALAASQQPVGDGCHCGTCACEPNMTPAVRFDLSPAQQDGGGVDDLIVLGKAIRAEFAKLHAAMEEIRERAAAPPSAPAEDSERYISELESAIITAGMDVCETADADGPFPLMLVWSNSQNTPVTPPSAPVEVEAKHIEALRSVRNVGVLYVEEREAIDAIITALAQRPSVAPVGVDALLREYRPSMDVDVLHAWAKDVVAARRAEAARLRRSLHEAVVHGNRQSGRAERLAEALREAKELIEELTNNPDYERWNDLLREQEEGDD